MLWATILGESVRAEQEDDRKKHPAMVSCPAIGSPLKLNGGRASHCFRRQTLCISHTKKIDVPGASPTNLL